MAMTESAFAGNGEEISNPRGRLAIIASRGIGGASLSTR